MEFKRTGNSKAALDLGGYSFSTLKPGAILQSKKFFGITKNGVFRGYHNSYVSFSRGQYLVVTKITRSPYNFPSIEGWKATRLDTAQEYANGIKNDLDKAPMWVKHVNLHEITKRKFDNRFEIIQA